MTKHPLSEYLENNGISVAVFAQQIGAKSRATIYRYINGMRFPRPNEMAKIKDVTNGAITYESFPPLYRNTSHSAPKTKTKNPRSE